MGTTGGVLERELGRGESGASDWSQRVSERAEAEWFED